MNLCSKYSLLAAKMILCTGILQIKKYLLENITLNCIKILNWSYFSPLMITSASQSFFHWYNTNKCLKNLLESLSIVKLILNFKKLISVLFKNFSRLIFSIREANLLYEYYTCWTAIFSTTFYQDYHIVFIKCVLFFCGFN